MFVDLREFVSELEVTGELNTIKCEVDWNLEMGAITRRVMDLRERAPLFENIKDYPHMRMLGCPLGPSSSNLYARFAIALGLAPDTKPLEIVSTVKDRIFKQIKPVKVSGGPCKENIDRNGKVDLLKFPAPLIHSIDGGRYLGTWHICITKDPETGWVNWGMYRLMVHSKDKLAILLTPFSQHGGSTFEKYRKMGKPMPIAIAIGTEPVSSIVAGAPLPEQMEEVEAAGGLRGKGVELVKCETVDIDVPASSEVVIEGEIPPEERLMEGPFGEYTGHSGAGKSLRPYIKVKCVTYRSNPILTMTNMGKPWHESDTVEGITRAAIVWKLLEDAALPVKGAYVHPTYFLVIAADSRPGLVHKIASVLKQPKSRLMSEYLLLVNEDVDITSAEDVLWAISTRLHPKNGIYPMINMGMNPLLPMLTPEEREARMQPSCLLDATFPSDWSKEYLEEHTTLIDFRHGWPPNMQKSVLERWEVYGYSKERTERLGSLSS